MEGGRLDEEKKSLKKIELKGGEEGGGERKKRKNRR